MDLGEKLKQLRKKAGKTLIEVKDGSGVSVGYLSRLERGEMENPSLEKLQKLADYYDVSIAYLLANGDEWKKLLPPEIREFVEGDDNFEYIRVVKKAKNDGWTPEAIQELMKIVKTVKNIE